MNAEITVAVSIACAVGGFCLSFAALRRGLRKDCADAGRHDGMVLAEIGYIKSGVDDIKAEQKALSGKVADMAVKGYAGARRENRLFRGAGCPRGAEAMMDYERRETI